jgi:dTDP-4-amino-4,6-dideoxygalactose transaminase
MKISLLDLKKQFKEVGEEIIKEIKNLCEQGQFILGEKVIELEKKLANYCGVKYGIGTGSGTDAIVLSLKAFNIKEGDEVILPDFTFFATAGAVCLVGGKPIFVDIELETYNIDPYLIEKAITPKTKAIIPVYLYGQCADMDPIIEIAKKYNLKIIEDSAQSIGAKYKNKPSCSMGDTGILSFFPTKNLGAYGDGGMVLTDDKNLEEKIKLLRVHGSKKKNYHEMVGLNSRLDALQACILLVKLKYLDKWTTERQRHAKIYDEELKEIEEIILPKVKEGNIHVYNQYIIRVKKDRDNLRRYLQENEIATQIYYPLPLHLQKCFLHLGYKKGDFPCSEEVASTNLSLPIYPELEEEEQMKIISCIKKFFKK